MNCKRVGFFVVAAFAFLMTFTATPLHAKRVGPKAVAPVVHNGVRYVAVNQTGREGRVEARHAESGQKLWDAVVYSVATKPNLEEDVQWAFITALQMSDDGKSLLVTNEKGDRYALDLKTKQSTKLEKEPARKG